MADCRMLVFTTIVLYGVWLNSDVLAMCDISSPITETAYVGAYEIRFPECPFGVPDTSRCSWIVSAYRKDYVIHLQFDDVILEKNYQDGACVEEITVYDGTKTTDVIIASFCGNVQPKLTTSSRDTLIVFSSNKSSVVNGTFKLKYKAIKDRQSSGDTSHILRVAFGAFIGTISCVVVFSWAFRKYKKARPNRGPSVFGRPRINTSTGVGHETISTAARNVATRAAYNGAVSQLERSERMSFKNKVSGFFQDVVMKLSPRRMTVDSFTTVSNHNTHHHQQGHQQLQNDRINRSQSRSNCNIRNNGGSGICPSNTSQNPFHAGMGALRDGHLAFGYPVISLSSFTSDPNAVRPPAYEDCINSVNPVYLNRHSANTFYNRAFDLKDEGSDCVQIFSPPPPYSEIGPEIPSLGVVPEGLSNSAGMFPCQQPPHYDTISPGVVVMTPANTEANEDDLASPEQSCERGETVINMTAIPERSTFFRPVHTTIQITQLLSLDYCNPLTSACIDRSEAVSGTVNNCTLQETRDDTKHSAESSGNSILTSSATQCHSHNTPCPTSITATFVPLDLLRRSGLVSVQSTDNSLVWNNEALSETCTTQSSKTTDPVCVKPLNSKSPETQMDSEYLSDQSHESNQAVLRVTNSTSNSSNNTEVENTVIQNIVLSDLEIDRH